MANGYVPPNFMRPHPFMPQHPLQRRFGPFGLQQQAYPLDPRGRSPNPHHVDPALLFASPQTRQLQQAQCLFPSAFPEHGPNIFQRFWIRLFHFLMTPIYLLWSGVRQAHTVLDDIYTNVDVDVLTLFVCENSWSLLIGLVVVVAVCLLAWFFSPKGENNTVWRSTLILTCASCYIMWAITFLSQWHPLIQPKMTKLRPGYPGMS